MFELQPQTFSAEQKSMRTVHLCFSSDPNRTREGPVMYGDAFSPTLEYAVFTWHQRQPGTLSLSRRSAHRSARRLAVPVVR